MYYLQLYYINGEVKRRDCRSLAYAKREADLLRTEEKGLLKKIEIYRSEENDAETVIIEAFYL